MRNWLSITLHEEIDHGRQKIVSFRSQLHSDVLPVFKLVLPTSPPLATYYFSLWVTALASSSSKPIVVPEAENPVSRLSISSICALSMVT